MCRKTKIKLLLWESFFVTDTDKQMNQLKTEAKTCSWHQAQEKVCEQVLNLGSVTSDWLRKWRKIFFCQSQSVAMQSQNNC